MIGVDFGSTYTDAVFFKKGKLKAYTVPSRDFSLQFLERLLAREKKGLALTGGIAAVEKKSPGLRKLERQTQVIRFKEIDAIAQGARHLTHHRFKKMLVVNVGTGSPLVWVDGSKARHLLGTGIGGGTLAGLGKLLLNADVEALEAMASRGKPALDLTVYDIAGGPVGIVPADATASNFAKAANVFPSTARREDVAYSIINLVSESIGTLAVSTARSVGAKEIVFTGRVVARNRRVRQRLAAVMRLFGKGIRMTVPQNAEYATAIGALKLAEMRK